MDLCREKKLFQITLLKSGKELFFIVFSASFKDIFTLHFEALTFFIVISVIFHIVIKSSALMCQYFEDTLISHGLDNTET